METGRILILRLRIGIDTPVDLCQKRLKTDNRYRFRYQYGTCTYITKISVLIHQSILTKNWTMPVTVSVPIPPITNYAITGIGIDFLLDSCKKSLKPITGTGTSITKTYRYWFPSRYWWKTRIGIDGPWRDRRLCIEKFLDFGGILLHCFWGSKSWFSNWIGTLNTGSLTY